MFDWKLFFCLILICIPGIVTLIPLLKVNYQLILNRHPTNKRMPSKNRFIIISIIQSIVLITIASAIGTAVSHKTNLHAPLLEALIKQEITSPMISNELVPAVALGTIGALLFLFAYYVIFNPLLDKTTAQCLKNLRMTVGIVGRIFYGGIVEEVICRWGLMSLFVWLGMILLGTTNSAIYWTAIILAGLLFAAGHVPGYKAFGCQLTFRTIIMIVTLNLGASLVFGWLFWQYGLSAAIIAHAIFHIVWYPFDVFTSGESRVLR